MGDWVTGSRWIDIFNREKLNTEGEVESFLVKNKVKRMLMKFY